MDGADVVMPPDGQVTNESGEPSGRAAVIKSATAAFKASPDALPGVECWAFVNMELDEKNQPRLSATERKALTA